MQQTLEAPTSGDEVPGGDAGRDGIEVGCLVLRRSPGPGGGEERVRRSGQEEYHQAPPDTSLLKLD